MHFTLFTHANALGGCVCVLALHIMHIDTQMDGQIANPVFLLNFIFTSFYFLIRSNCFSMLKKQKKTKLCTKVHVKWAICVQHLGLLIF